MRQTVRIKQIILALMISFVCLSLGRADEPNALDTIDDYLNYAMLNNAGVKAKFEQFKSAVEQVPQAKALEDPTFTYGYFVEEVETRVGPQRNRFSIMQKFPWFGVIGARTDAASAKAKAAHHQYEAARLELFRQVKDAFFEYAYLRTATDIAEQNLELIKHFEEVARSKYRTSTATHPDIIRAQVELAELEDVLKSLQELRAPTVSQLNASLNRPADAPLSWPQKPPPKQIVLEQEKIIELLVQSNPELAALDWQSEAARANLALARKRFYPNFSIGVDVIQTDNALMPNVRDSGKDPVILMFSVNIPLWQDSYKAGQRQAQAEMQKTQQQKVDIENRLIAQTVRVLYDIKDAQRKIKLYGDVLVAKAKELLDASESAYKAGNIDFLSLIDAQRMLLRYQLDYDRVVTNREQKIAELEMLVGQEL
jgi:cobalt-zinc-cadmium efflux system outer membrane protein